MTEYLSFDAMAEDGVGLVDGLQTEVCKVCLTCDDQKVQSGRFGSLRDSGSSLDPPQLMARQETSKSQDAGPRFIR